MRPLTSTLPLRVALDTQGLFFFEGVSFSSSIRILRLYFLVP